jgi:O-antigen ligase
MINKKTQQPLVYFYNFIQKNLDAIANYVLIFYAFFIPITGEIVHDGFNILFVLLIFKKDKISTIKQTFSNPIVVAFFIYVGMNYLGVLTSDYKDLSLVYARYYKFFIYSALIVAFAKHKYIQQMIYSFLAGVIFSSILSYSLIFGFLTSPFPYSYLLAASASNPSPFMYHIEFGFLLAFSAVLLLQMLYQQRKIKEKILIAIFFIFISIAIFLNISRTGYIIYFLGITLFYFLHFKKDFLKVFPFFILSIAIVISTLYYLSSTFESRVNVALKDIEKIYYDNNYNTSIGLRIVEMKQATELVLKKPLTGYGTARHVSTMYKDAKEKKLFYADTIERYSTTDSQYFDTLLQWGFLGLLVFLNIFYQAFKYKQEDSYLREMQIILITLYLINSFQTYTMLGQIPYTLFFILSLTTIKKDKLHSST